MTGTEEVNERPAVDPPAFQGTAVRGRTGAGNFVRLPHNPLPWVVSICLVALTIPAYRWLDAERRNAGAIPAVLDRQLTGLRSDVRGGLIAEVSPLITLLGGTPGAMLKVVDQHATNIEEIASKAVADADARVGESLGKVDAGIAELRVLRMDLEPVIQHADLAVQDADKTVTLAQPELVGFLRDSRAASVSVARTVNYVREQMPDYLVKVGLTLDHIRDAADASAHTAVQSANFMGHLAKGTELMPKWFRLAVSVSPPIVQTGFTVAEWLALRGKSQ